MLMGGTAAWAVAILFSGAMQGGAQTVDLSRAASDGKLRAVNREVAPLEGTPGAVHVSERANEGLVWVQGSSLGVGTIEVDVRGRDVVGRSFLGIAFHGKDDKTYEAVYLRPFNFRATDPDRHQHAVQYMMVPDFDWPKLRQDSPEEFENPVDQAVSPTDWVTLRVVIGPKSVQIFVGPSKTPALEARKLGQLYGGMVGLWTGNNSDGDFRNLRITPDK
jgi:hypothetical protein